MWHVDVVYVVHGVYVVSMWYMWCIWDMHVICVYLYVMCVHVGVCFYMSYDTCVDKQIYLKFTGMRCKKHVFFSIFYRVLTMY